MIWIVTLYLVAVFVIGYVASKRIKDSEDYYLGGKSFGPWLTAFKFSATWESGAKLVGGPGMAYSAGLPAFLQGLATPFGYLLSFTVFGRRLKTSLDYFNTITTPEILEKRYKSSVIRTIAAIALLLGLIGTLVGQYKAIGEVVAVVIGVDYKTALFISIVIVGFYTIAGGYLASVWTDFVQGIIMFLGAILVFIFVTKEFSNFSISNLNAEIAKSWPHMLEITGGGVMKPDVIIAMIVITLFMGVALPQQTVAIYSMKDPKVGHASLIISIVFSTVLIWGLYLAAMASKTFITVDNPDSLMPLIANEYLPPIVGGLFIAAIVSAIMSTIDGVILVAASIFSRDIFKRLVPKKYEKSPVKWDRWGTVIITIIPLLFAINPPTIVFWIIAFSFSLIVFTFLMPMLGIIYFKRATKKAVIVQMIATIILMPLWTILGEPFISGMGLGLITAPVIFIVVSLLTKQEDDEKETADLLWKEYKAKGV